MDAGSNVCPFCGAAIALTDVNVATDVALCRACGRTSSFAGLVQGGGHAAVEKPEGCEYEEFGDGWRVSATTRSWAALLLVPFTCVWAGMSMTGLYGTQVRSGHFDVVQSLFGIPFVLGSLALLMACLMSVAGKIEVASRDEKLNIFTGVGVVGWRRSYLWDDFTTVREGLGQGNFNTNRGQVAILLEGRRRVSFGTGLSEARRYFVMNLLRHALVRRTRAGGGDWDRIR